MSSLRRFLLPSAASIAFFVSAGIAARVGPRELGVREAQAKSGYESPYSYDQTWTTALRLVRVDLGFKIVEKDEKAGYVLFEYADKGSTSSASLELLPGDRGVRVVCQIPKFPSYHEAVVLDRLSRKLREEHGNPPERTRPPPVDAGRDGAADGDL
jgi:hypothetical protein